MPSDWNPYVAGFFDGEGSVTICRQRAGRYSDYHKVVVCIGQRVQHRRVLDEIAAEFGGAVWLRKRQKTRVSRRWAQQAVWQLQRREDIERFLQTIQPYLRVKNESVRIALEFLGTMQRAPVMRDEKGHVLGRSLAQEEIDRREEYRQAIQEANRLVGVE